MSKVCDFCGVSQHKVEHLIESRGGSHICDKCVEFCTEVIKEKKAKQNPIQPQKERESV